MTDTTTSGRPQSLNVFLDPEQYDFLRRQWSDQYIWSPAPVPGDIPLHRTAFISDLDEKEAAEEEAERQKREEEARKKKEEEAHQQQLVEEEARAAAAAADEDVLATQTGDNEGSELARDPEDEGLPDLAEADESGRGGSGHRKRDSAISVASRSSGSSQGHTLPARPVGRHDDGGETLPSPPRRAPYGPTPQPLPLSRGEAADVKGPRGTTKKPFRRPAPIITNPNPKRLRSFHLPALRGDATNDSNKSNTNSHTNKDTQVTGLPIIASPVAHDTPYTNQPIMASPSGVVASPTSESPSAFPEVDAGADMNYTHGPEDAPAFIPPPPETEDCFSMYATAPGTLAAEHEGHDLEAQTPRGSGASLFTDPDVVVTPRSKMMTSPPLPMASQNVVQEVANMNSSMSPTPPAPVAPVAAAPGIAAASTAPMPEVTANVTSTRRNRDHATSESPLPNRASRAAHKGKASSLPSNLPSASHQKKKKKTASPSNGLAPPPGFQRAHSAPAPQAAHKRSLTLQLDLNIDVEVELHAKIGGDLTLTLF